MRCCTEDPDIRSETPVNESRNALSIAQEAFFGRKMNLGTHTGLDTIDKYE